MLQLGVRASISVSLVLAGGVLGMRTAVPRVVPPPQFEKFTADMKGSSERPPVDSKGTGKAEIEFDANGAIVYTVTVKNLTSKAVSAHLHGPADTSVSAPVILNLTTVEPVMSGTVVAGTIAAKAPTSIGLDSIKALMRAGKLYINVHTSMHPDGEIRGQVVKKK